MEGSTNHKDDNRERDERETCNDSRKYSSSGRENERLSYIEIIFFLSKVKKSERIIFPDICFQTSSLDPDSKRSGTENLRVVGYSLTTSSRKEHGGSERKLRFDSRKAGKRANEIKYARP